MAATVAVNIVESVTDIEQLVIQVYWKIKDSTYKKIIESTYETITESTYDESIETKCSKIICLEYQKHFSYLTGQVSIYGIWSDGLFTEKGRICLVNSS